MKTILNIVAVLGICLALSVRTAMAAATPPLVVELAKQNHISEAEAKAQLDRVVTAIKAELKAGRDVTITNFGKFYVQDRAPRTGRNPKTGAPIEIEAKRYPRFVSADGFKDEMNAKDQMAENMTPAVESQAEGSNMSEQ